MQHEAIFRMFLTPSTPVYGWVYLITNMVNGKVYIGQTTRTPERYWKYQHLGSVRSKQKWGKYLYQAIRKYGRDKFTFEILAEAPDKASLDHFEDFYILSFRSMDRTRGYNQRRGGHRGKLSAEHAKKLRASRVGVPRPDFSEYQTLHNVATRPEVAAKISAALTGRKQPRKQVERRAAALRMRWAITPRPPISEETRQKMRDSARNRRYPQCPSK